MTVEVDRLQADSKFFRSLVFVFLLAAAVSFREASLWVPAVAVLLTFFAIWRFCDLSWTATKRVYEYYLLLHSTHETGNEAESSQEECTGMDSRTAREGADNRSR